MAIRVRRGNQADFDGNKLVAGELGLVLDKGELYFCYSPGNTKRLQTAEDLQNLLNASPEAYQALQQLASDLTANPNELANILSNISALQTDKFDKANIVQTDTISDATKVASTVVTTAHRRELDELNKNSTEMKTVTSPVGNIVWGGYIKVGAVVIVNVKLTTTVAVSPNDAIVSGLPYSVTNAAMRILNAYTGAYLDGWLNITHIKSSASIPSGAILNISCCYLSS